MTTCTPLYGLEYAIGTDPPCNIGTTLCDFADSVETQLDALDAIVDRTIDTVPMAIVTLSVTATLSSLGGTFQLPWDTVNVDTASMVDLTGNSYAITLPRYGRYWVSWYFQINGLAVSSSETAYLSSVNAISPPSSSNITGPNSGFYSDGSSVQYMSAAAEIRFGPSPSTITNVSGTPGSTGIALSVNVSNGATIPSATLSAIWIGDL